MRFSSLLFLITLVAVGCTLRPQPDEAAIVPNADVAHAQISGPEVDAARLSLHANEGRMYHEDSWFTGVAVTYYPDGQLAKREVYQKGQRSGLVEQWYTDGTPSYRARYQAGKRHGAIETWWPDGTPRTHLNYANGVAHGEQRQWYQSGALFKALNLDHGRESGLQQAWRENGALYANYESRDGRIYGLMRAKLCYDLDDETIQVGQIASMR